MVKIRKKSTMESQHDHSTGMKMGGMDLCTQSCGPVASLVPMAGKEEIQVSCILESYFHRLAEGIRD